MPISNLGDTTENFTTRNANNAAKIEKVHKSEVRPNKNRNTMPPIVIDGKMANQRDLLKDLKDIVKGEFSIKHINYTCIMFVENKEDHQRVLSNNKSENMPYHTYTSRNEKSHAFVLKGLTEGTKIVDIEENLEEEHEIKPRAVYQIRTKERPLFLVVTDPVITLRLP